MSEVKEQGAKTVPPEPYPDQTRPTKSTLVIDILPKEKETNLQELEKAIRNIQLTGVEWKAARTEDIAFGLKKLQIMALIVDQMVRMEDLEERILGLKDLVKSMEVVAWNKV